MKGESSMGIIIAIIVSILVLFFLVTLFAMLKCASDADDAMERDYARLLERKQKKEEEL